MGIEQSVLGKNIISRTVHVMSRTLAPWERNHIIFREHLAKVRYHESGHDYTQYNLGEMLAKGLRKLRKGGMKVKVHFEVDGTVSRKPYNILQLLTIVITVITPLGNNLSREAIL